MKATPHIDPQAPIAETILLPGDPLRAKFIAETYLEDAVQFNSVRNMLGFTGTYQGTEVSVMGSGMGIPSISLYAYELVHTFGATKLIRVGSCGSMQKDIGLYEIIVAQGACTDSNFLEQYNMPGTFAPISSFRLLRALVDAADAKGITTHVGNISPPTPSTTSIRPPSTGGLAWVCSAPRWNPPASTPLPRTQESRRSESLPSRTTCTPARRPHPRSAKPRSPR